MGPMDPVVGPMDPAVGTTILPAIVTARRTTAPTTTSATAKAIRRSEAHLLLRTRRCRRLRRPALGLLRRHATSAAKARNLRWHKCCGRDEGRRLRGYAAKRHTIAEALAQAFAGHRPASRQRHRGGLCFAAVELHALLWEECLPATLLLLLVGCILLRLQWRPDCPARVWNRHGPRRRRNMLGRLRLLVLLWCLLVLHHGLRDML